MIPDWRSAAEEARLTSLVDEARRLGTPVAVGAIGSVLATIGALAPRSPAVHHPVRRWFVGILWPPFSGDLSVLVSAAVFFAGVVLLSRGWIGVLRRTSGPTLAVSPRAVIFVFALWAAPLMLAPPLLTRDPYSYVAQGEVYCQGLDPYRQAPYVLGTGEFLREVDPLWRSSPSPYGPLFMMTARAAVEASGHRPLVAILLLRLACLGGLALLAAGVPRLARAVGHSPTDAVALVLLNPITVVHLVGGMHNEAIMVGLLVFGLALAVEGRPLVGVALCALAATVKLPAVAGVAFVAWHWAHRAGAGRRLLRLGAATVTAAAVLVGVNVIAGTSWDWVTLVTTPTKVTSRLSPVTAVGTGLASTLSLVGVPSRAFLSAWQLLFIGVGLAISLRCLIRVPDDGPARATGTALLAIAVLSPVMYPFYLLWGLAPLAAAGLRWTRPLVVAGSVCLTFTLLPGAADLLHAIVALGPWWAGGLLLGLVSLTLPVTRAPLRAA